MNLPIRRPGKIIAAGMNYRDHAEEQGLDLPSRPLLFAKWTSSLVGPDDEIVLPTISTQVDYEAELGVVIGTQARNVAAEDALDYVAGYICVNDVSARDLQTSDGQWTRAKSLDTFCPVGPLLVPASEIADPHSLDIKCRVNGETRQDSNTRHLAFDVSDLIAFVSAGVTLEPGDLIATGTPGGVGAHMEPPTFLESGDVVEVEIESIGTLTNRVVAAR